MSNTPERAAQLSLNAVPGTPVVNLGDGVRTLTRTSPVRPIRTDGLSLTGASTGGSALEQSLFSRFVQRNVDLLAIFDQDEALLERVKTVGFQDREDLQQLLVDAVSASFSADSPLNAGFLTRNPEITRFLALNPGQLRDRIVEDPGLQASLADGDTIQAAIQDLVNREAARQTGDLGGLDLEFFQANPLAAAYLLDRPAELRRIGADSTEEAAELFRRRFYFDRDVIETAVVDKASALLDNPSSYSDDLLRDDPAFSTLLVGANRLESHKDLVAYLRDGRNLSLDGVDVDQLLRQYEVHKAISSLPAGGPLDAAFLSRNVGIALVLNEDSALRDAIVQDRTRLSRLGVSANDPRDLSNGELFFQIYSRTSESGARVDFYF